LAIVTAIAGSKAEAAPAAAEGAAPAAGDDKPKS
jgi:hypothetical protein